MDIAELKRYLYATVFHCVDVHVSDVEKASGWVRRVTIHHGNHVTIMYEPSRLYLEGNEEDYGIKLVGRYPSLERLVDDLEAFLGGSMSTWTNRSANEHQPRHLDEVDPEANYRYFVSQVRAGSLPLPSGAPYEHGSLYWGHIARFGEHRPDRHTSPEIHGELSEWPTKERMLEILRDAGLSVTVGAYSIRVDDCSHFVFQEYGGDIGEPVIDADADSLQELLAEGGLVSDALAKAGVRHVFEAYDSEGVLVGYLHHDWPATD